MSYGPELTNHLMREIMSFDARQEPGQSIEAAMGAVLTVAVEMINAAPTDARKAEMTIMALRFLIEHADTDKTELVNAAMAVALSDVEGSA